MDRIEKWITNNTSFTEDREIPDKYLNLPSKYNKTNLECLDKILDQTTKRELMNHVQVIEPFKKLVGTVLLFLMKKPLFDKRSSNPLKRSRLSKLKKDDERLFPKCLEIVFWILEQLYREKKPIDKKFTFSYTYNTVIDAFTHMKQRPTKLDPDINFKDLEGRICGILTNFSYWTSIMNIITLIIAPLGLGVARDLSMWIAGKSIDAFYASFMNSTYLSTILTQMMAFVENANISFIHIDSQMAMDTYRFTESHLYGLADYLGVQIPSVATALQTNPYLANVVSFILPYVSTANVGLVFIVMMINLFTKEQTLSRKLGYIMSILYYMKYSIYVVNAQFFTFIVSWLFICLLTKEIYQLLQQGVNSTYYIKQHLMYQLWSFVSGKK